MTAFSKLLQSGPEYASLALNVKNGRYPFGVLGLGPAAKHLVIQALCDVHSRGALVLVPDERAAERCCDDLCTMGTRAAVFPARDLNFQAQSSSTEYEQKRIGALARVRAGTCDVLVCSAEALLQVTVPPQVLDSRIFTLKKGQTVSTAEVRAMLVRAGYSYADMVEGAGQFSLRGGILDIFPANEENPVRLEFWGDEIDSISRFDVLSQRREEELPEVSVPPCSEVLFENDEAFIEALETLKKGLRGKSAAAAKENIDRDIALLQSGLKPGDTDKYFPLAYEKPATVLDYFSEAFFFVCETSAVKERAAAYEKLLSEEIKSLFLSGALCRGLDRYAVTFDRLCAAYTERQTVYLDNFARGSFDTPVKDLISYHVNMLSRWDGSYKILTEDISPALRAKYTIVVLAGTLKAARGLLEELADDGIPALLATGTPGAFQPGYVNVMPGAVSGGLDYAAGKTLIVTYGRDAKSSRASMKRLKKNADAFRSLEELHKGDYVVHQTNGIGIFEGIEKVQMEGVTKDYIKLSYAKGDVLFVPVTKLELISKYIGPREEDGRRTVKINRLGSGDWEKTKARVRTAVQDIAADLIKLYAARQSTPGYAFSPDIDMQNDFERRFPFDETEDQLHSIDEIKNDMEKPVPMDRLLCGDVGFGKTEVALRAAFKCVCDGKQVAILVPTTILALQHYRTVMQRFEGFPVEAQMLSRFCSAKDQKLTLAKTKAGAVDILVGTHRLISKDVQFKDLGLLIVDEEQRFGVAQKERLKEKFPTVDVLTLSATPIPRTLNFAMTGLRDLSVIEEAPADRYPVQTYVVEHDWGILQQAMEKELRRGGQIYYLHNRVETIEECAAEIKKLFPDANIGVAHGKMNEEQLSDVWKALVEGEIDILVCTTIIETGVDVPNVNTLIIEDADRMGLAQLHQLRGRVGRSSRRASAYCTFRRGKELSEVADKRLSAIREFTQFGSGFKIAMRDLEIRGAGNLLGAQQHGHIETVGYDMYVQLLTEAVSMLKTGEASPPPRKDCLVDLQIDAHIPDAYIESYPQRIAIYKRIADIHSPDDAMDVTDELIDRYGEPPESVMGLIKVALLKNAAADNGISEITQRDNALILYVSELDKVTLAKLSVLRGRVRANASGRPYYAVRLLPKQSPIGTLEQIVACLTADASPAGV